MPTDSKMNPAFFSVALRVAVMLLMISCKGREPDKPAAQESQVATSTGAQVPRRAIDPRLLSKMKEAKTLAQELRTQEAVSLRQPATEAGVKAAVDQKKAALATCAEGAKGTVRLELTISEDPIDANGGRISAVKAEGVEGDTKTLETCALGALQNARFERPVGGTFKATVGL